MFLLFVTHPKGYVEVLTFPTAFDRAIEMIRRQTDPVVLRVKDPQAHG